jgi:biopolymer transport protein ExbD|tara:strand:+ start:666 stop:1058 length:393 start_codon:yes stop_codon:yes gene_type:complete
VLEKKKIKINIIPLIDIIFLMLVFFMLATNFYEKRDMEFSIEKNISENSELKETTVIKIQKNEYVFENKKIEKKSLEDQLLKIWNQDSSKNFVILNDKSSEIKTLIYILDILKKNKIKNVTFANDPSEKK